MTFVPIDGPIRVVQDSQRPFHFIAVDRLGRYLAQGSERALTGMAEAWNHNNKASGEREEPVKVTACPACGYPKESEEQTKCLSCLNPPEPTVEEEVKKAETEQNAWF